MSKYSFCAQCSLLQCPIAVPKITEHKKPIFVVSGLPITLPHQTKIISMLDNISTNDVHFTSVLKCPVLGYKVKPIDIHSCANILLKEIEYYKPRFVIGLGPIPLLTFMQQKKGIVSKRGRFYVSEGIEVLDYTVDVNIPKFVKWPSPILFFPTISLQNAAIDPSNARALWDDFYFITDKLKDKHSWSDRVGDYYVVKDFEVANRSLMSIMNTESYSLDIESTGFNEHLDTTLGIGFSFQEFTAFYIPLAHKVDDKIVSFWNEEQRAVLLMRLKDVMKSKSVKFIHNYMFEQRFLSKLLGCDVNNGFCTMSYHHLVNPSTKQSGDSTAVGGNQSGAKRLALGTLTSSYIDLSASKDIWEPFKKKENKGKNLADLYSVDKIGEYCSEDCDGTFRVGSLQLKDSKTSKFGSFFTRRFMPTLKFIAKTQSHGINVDFDYIHDHQVVLEEEAKEIKERVQEKASKYMGKEFNPNSSLQVSKLLYQHLKMPQINGTKTTADILDILKVNHGCDIAQDILDYRRVTKIWKTYFVGIEKFINPVTRRVHANFKPCGTETGRISITKPAMQTLPRKYSKIIKSIFIPTDGMVLFSADYSQIELRLIAWLSQDPVLLDAYTRGRDIHGITAAKLFSLDYDSLDADLKIDPHTTDSILIKRRTEAKHQRDIGKNANFALCYGGSANVLVGMAGNSLLGPEYNQYSTVDARKVEDRAKYFRKQYLELYSGLTPWMNRTIAQARQDGYVTSAYGYTRHLPFINSKDSQLRTSDERKAINTDPQGTASFYLLFRFEDIMDEANRCGINGFSLNMVHDALYLESEKGSESEMSNIISTVGVQKDESNITVPMILEPEMGMNMSEI